MNFRKGQAVSVQAILIIALLAGGLLWVSSTGQLSGPGAGDAQGDDDSVASIYLKANDALDSSQPSYVNVSYEVMDQEGIIVAEGTTDTSQGFTQITDLDENSDYTVRMYDDDGSSDDYYLSRQTVTTGESVKRAIVDVTKEGSATTDIFETSGATDDDDTLVVNQGATETFDVEVTENTQNAVFNQPALVVKTNDTDVITELEVSGSTAESVPDRLSSYDDLYDTGTSEIVDFNKVEYTVQVTRSESNSDSATVDVAVVDRASFKNDQGEWVQGYEDSDDADVGAPDATTDTVTVN